MLRRFVPPTVAACASILAAACSNAGSSTTIDDPEASYDAAALEAPLELQPGFYELRLGGSTVVELRSATRTDQICLDSYGATHFSKDPLGWTIEPWETCSNELDPPQGNAMSGARKCEQRGMPMIARYTGTHTTDSFKIHGFVSQGTGENEQIMHLGSGDFSISGTRIGDCPV